jgi:hypothetical protein
MRWLAAVTAPSVDPDDVVQEALIRAWTKHSSLDPARGSVRTWLLALTVDQAKRLKTWRRGVGACRSSHRPSRLGRRHPVPGNSPTGRFGRNDLTPLADAGRRAGCGHGAVFGLAHGPRTHHAGPATAGHVEIGCSIPGLTVDAARPGRLGNIAVTRPRRWPVFPRASRPNPSWPWSPIRPRRSSASARLTSPG